MFGASEWDTGKCFKWCSFLLGEYSDKEGREQMDRSGVCPRGDGSEPHLLGFLCPPSPSVSPCTWHSFVSRPWSWRGTLAK